MLRSLAASVTALISLGVHPDDDEAERFRKRVSTVVVAAAGVIGGPVLAAIFLAFDRPQTAAIFGLFGLLSTFLLGYLFITKRGYLFVRGSLALGFAVPVALMWSLGGFAQGGAAILWSFSISLVALAFWGSRAAILWLVAFGVALIASALLESLLSSAVDPLPPAAQTWLFVQVIASGSVVNLAVILYFVRQRDITFARSESLLLNVLPAGIVGRLKIREADVADRFESASVLFADIVDFTAFAGRVSPERLVQLLGRLFDTLDELAEHHGVEKIKTLGDGYLAVAGLPDHNPAHATATARMALDIAPAVMAALGADWTDLRFRIGIASGPLVAGVIGKRRFSYDVWGDTVNTASRMASIAEPGSIVVTAKTASLLDEGFRVEDLPEVEVKGKGLVRPYRLLGVSPSA